MQSPSPHALANKLVALTLTLLIFAGTLGLGAVWVRQEIFQAADRSRALEVRLADVKRRIDEVNAEVAAALNPDALIRRNETMRLGLAMPREVQVERVATAPEIALVAKRNREIFGLANASLSGEPGFRLITASLR